MTTYNATTEQWIIALENRCAVQLMQLSDLQNRHHRLAGRVAALEQTAIVDIADPPMPTEHLLAELRRPGQPQTMPNFVVRLDSDQLNLLQIQSNRLHTYPAALARSLVVRGLKQLEGEVS